MIYLDCDTVATDSLGPLWDLQWERDDLVAAVTAPLQPSRRDWPTTLGLESMHQYFGSGVLMMNLSGMRAENTPDKIIRYGRENAKRLIWPDQDALNAILARRRVDIHPRWNLMNSISLKYQTNEVFLESELEEALLSPAIVHFEGHPVGKPWEANCQHPFRDLYFRHLGETPWRDAETHKRQDLFRVRSIRPFTPSSLVRRSTQVKHAPLSSEQKSISVVIPTRNRAQLLRLAVASALSQSLKIQEVIVVDDASDDDTDAVVLSFNDARIRHIRNDFPLGAGACRNVGIEAARGDMVAFLDDDDIWFTDKLEKQYTKLWQANHLDDGLCLCGYVRLEGRNSRSVCSEGEFDIIDFSQGVDWRYRVIATSGWLVPRELLVRAGMFDTDLHIWEDWELALRLYELGKFVYVAEPLFLFNRNRPVGQTENWRVRQQTLGQLLAKHGEKLNASIRLKAKHEMQSVIIVRWRIKDDEVRAGLLRSIRADPTFVLPLLWLVGYSGLPYAKRIINALSRRFPSLEGL